MNDAPPPTRGWRQRLSDAVLGTDELQRRCVMGSLLGTSIYIVCVLLEGVSVALGLGDAAEVRWLVLYMLAGPLVFYAVLRGGWGRRARDPSLTLPQLVYAVSALVLAYPVNGPSRGLNLMLIALVPVFGMQVITPRQARGVGLLSMALLAPMMLWLALARGDRFDPRVELVHFILAAACIPLMCFLVAQICAMRERLKQQRTALRDALARIDRQARHDALTGLANRREMGERLRGEAQRQARSGRLFCVLLIDIDHFKRINDTHGHAAGDWVLRRFAAVGGDALRAGDLLARWGGEEFVLLLPETGLDAARHAAERLRRRWAAADVWAERAELRVSFSAGLAEHAGGDPMRTVESADRALYRAKSLGRDRVVLADATAS